MSPNVLSRVSPPRVDNRRLAGVAIALVVFFGLALAPSRQHGAETPPEHLASRPRPPQPTLKSLAIGDEVRTERGQRRRLYLSDGTVLYVNESSTVKVEAADRVLLTTGEVFVDAAARNADSAPLAVQTPKGEVSGRTARFAVRAAAVGTGVLVASGEATVNGVPKPVRAGQQLTPGAEKPSPAPRASHLLAWTRDLMANADSPLVPASKHTGGALVAIDPDGQEAKLSLRKYHVDVHVEDGFARTTIDQTYFNHEPTRLEGTFYFPLPADASLSRLAMYVDGTLMEGGMAERDYARQVYETIRYAQRDPALLEWVDGSTFKMRVFPLEPRQEKRIVLSYTQKLPVLYGQTVYRFPAGHSLGSVRDWSFHARLKNGVELAGKDGLPAVKTVHDGADLLVDASATNVRLDHDVVLTLSEGKDAPEDDVARFSSTEHEGAQYLMLRYRPSLPGQAERQQRDWVFLFESSGDRDPLLARTQIEVLRSLLAQAAPDDTFAVLTAGTRVRPFAAETQPVTPENVGRAVAFLESAHLIGALDLGQALRAAEPFFKSGKDPYLVHLGSGIAAMGERRDDVLAKSIPDGVRYVGVGVGKRWARNFMKAAAERTGGYFTQINPDEPLSWRAFELAATLNTPRLLDVKVEAAGRARFLTHTSLLAQGEELCAITRLGPKEETPESVTISGTLDGHEFRRTVPVKDVAERADSLPRTWAKLEIDRLLAEDAAKHKDEIVALSKAMYVMTPFTSLLVLENEDQYVQYKVDRGRKDHWAMYPCPAKISVVYEPLPGMPARLGEVVSEQKLTVNEVRQTVLSRSQPSSSGASASQRAPSPALFGLRNGATTETIEFGAETGLPSPLLLGDFRREIAGSMGKSRPQPVSPWLNLNRDGAASVNSYNLVQPAGDRPVATALQTFQAGTNAFIKTNDATFSSELGRAQGSGSGEGKMFIHARNSVENEGIQLEPPGLVRSVRVEPEASLRERLTAVLAPVTPSAGEPASPVLYRRPTLNADDRLFYDLVAYAPGMETTWADTRAVIEAEAASHHHSRSGLIDPAARRLLDRARETGWQALTLPAENDRPALTIVFNGTGQYAYERTLPPGIRERVVCDGKTLLHLYPDLGIGARRSISRFHRSDFASLVPWVVPPAEDFVHGADLKLVDERTVAVVPHRPMSAPGDADKKAKYTELRLIFADNGRLAEQQVVEMPSSKVLGRQLCGADGVVKLLDAAGKEVFVQKGTLRPVEAPKLKADTTKLVVLPLPYRAPDHVRKTLKLENKRYEDLRFEDALALFAANFAAQNNDVVEVFRRSFHGRDQRQLGFYVLLAACGQNLDAEHLDVLAEHPDVPLAQYLALYSSSVLRKHASQWAVRTGQWPDGLLQQLALPHALLQRWQNEKADQLAGKQRQAERERALEYVRRSEGSVFGWGLLCLMQDRAGEDKSFHRALADLWPRFANVPGLGYSARYEEARSLWKAGQHEEARKHFRTLYEKTFKDGILPAIDADFRQALAGTGSEADVWSELVRQTAQRMIEQKHRFAVLRLAWQCWQLEDQPLATDLLAVALNGIPAKESLAMTLAEIQFLHEVGQIEPAERLLRKLLDDPKLARRADLWRLGATLAERRDDKARALDCLERALDAEYRSRPELLNLQTVRTEYGKLLEHYQSLADALVALKMRPPTDFEARVIRTADRWRALDPEGNRACELAAQVLERLGDRDLVWDYLTTPIAHRPSESEPWHNLGQSLARKGNLVLADRAYRAAFEAEPTNAELLWDRAQNLRQAGRQIEADKLLHQLAEGRWQPRFQWIQSQARRHVKGS